MQMLSSDDCWMQSADFGPRTALKIVDAIRDDIRTGKVKTKDDVRSAHPEMLAACLGNGCPFQRILEECWIIVTGYHGGSTHYILCT